MEAFKKLNGIVASLPQVNIDTDAIIPKQFLKTIDRAGLGQYLFYDKRYDEDNNLNKDFVLNKEPWTKSSVIVAGDNFGCGSSREHAPWALLDFGIKSIISTSFADIFYNNCFKNGILPIKIDDKIVVELAEYSKRKEEIEISLKEQEIKYGNKIAKFELDSFKKKCLMEGLDDIALSMEKISKIDDYEKKLQNTKPWVLNNV